MASSTIQQVQGSKAVAGRRCVLLGRIIMPVKTRSAGSTNPFHPARHSQAHSAGWINDTPRLLSVGLASFTNFDLLEGYQLYEHVLSNERECDLAYLPRKTSPDAGLTCRNQKSQVACAMQLSKAVDKQITAECLRRSSQRGSVSMQESCTAAIRWKRIRPCLQIFAVFRSRMYWT